VGHFFKLPLPSSLLPLFFRVAKGRIKGLWQAAWSPLPRRGNRGIEGQGPEMVWAEATE